MKTGKKKFKVLEKNAKDAPSKDIPWEGEELVAESKTKITDDLGSGGMVKLVFFDVAANPEVFRHYKPTEQELFNSSMKGIEATLWEKGLKPFTEVQPRLLWSVDGRKYEPYSPKGKQYKFYRFVVAGIPSKGFLNFEKPKTLSQLLTNSKT